jgi:hypothetical protein
LEFEEDNEYWFASSVICQVSVDKRKRRKQKEDDEFFIRLNDKLYSLLYMKVNVLRLVGLGLFTELMLEM